MMQKFGHVEITCSFALILPQHGHRGCIESTPIADAVEALHAEGVEFAAESLGPGWRHLDSRALGKSVHEGLPCTDVALVVLRGKLRNPEALIGVCEIRLGSR